MGLTIHYTLSVKENLSAGVDRELARRTAHYARKIGCAEASEPYRAEAGGSYAPLFFEVGKPKSNDSFFNVVQPLRGWLVNVCPGAGCETTKLGLCQYPRRILFRGQPVPTGFEGGWQFHSFCKTQYAGEHGWENFLKCHLLVISLLDFWRDLGVRVKVNDEGGYWETRSVEKLRAELGGYDRLVAAMGGMFKDACGDGGSGLLVESPIFDYKNFELLEHEGRREFGGRIRELQRKLVGKNNR